MTIVNYVNIAARLEPGSDTLKQMLSEVPPGRRGFLSQLSKLPLDERAARLKDSMRGLALRSPDDMNPLLIQKRLEMDRERRVSLGQRLVGDVLHNQIHGLPTMPEFSKVPHQTAQTGKK